MDITEKYCSSSNCSLSSELVLSDFLNSLEIKSGIIYVFTLSITEKQRAIQDYSYLQPDQLSRILLQTPYFTNG